MSFHRYSRTDNKLKLLSTENIKLNQFILIINLTIFFFTAHRGLGFYYWIVHSINSVICRPLIPQCGKAGTTTPSQTLPFKCSNKKFLFLSMSLFFHQRLTFVQVSRMYFFLLHLSLADILTAFFSLLPEILWTLTLPEFYGGNLLCRTMKFLQVSVGQPGQSHHTDPLSEYTWQ